MYDHHILWHIKTATAQIHSFSQWTGALRKAREVQIKIFKRKLHRCAFASIGMNWMKFLICPILPLKSITSAQLTTSKNLFQVQLYLSHQSKTLFDHSSFWLPLSFNLAFTNNIRKCLILLQNVQCHQHCLNLCRYTLKWQSPNLSHHTDVNIIKDLSS